MNDWYRILFKVVLKKWPVLLLSLGVTFGSYLLLWQHYTNVNVLLTSDLIYRIESKILDFKFKLRGIQQPSGKVGILAVDEKSVTKFGDWPFSRRYYGQALRNLKNLGVTVIGFDAVFAEPQWTRLNDVTEEINALRSVLTLGSLNSSRAREHLLNLEKWKQISRADWDFARHVEPLSGIVLGYFTFNSEDEAKRSMGDSPDVDYFHGMEQLAASAAMYDAPDGKLPSDFPGLRKIAGIRANYEELNRAGKHFGFFSNEGDEDAINRWITLVTNINNEVMPSLSLKSAAEALDRDVFVVFGNYGVDAVSLVSRINPADAIEIPVDPYGGGRMLINQYGPGRTFQHFSLSDAYYNTFTPAEKKRLRGMTLLLGGTATGTQDVRPNSFDPSIDGVENHVAAMENIFTQNFLRRDRTLFERESRGLLISALIAIPLMVWGSSLGSLLFTLAYVAGIWLFDWYFVFAKGMWVLLAIPTLQVLVLFVVTLFYKYVVEEREKRVVKGAFQHYLSPAVIEQMLEDPESMGVGGARKDITVFFSDVRGFTTISETLSPEKLCEFMNLYFNPMTSIILETGGTLDKYIGDAIMAFWGAPISSLDHAHRAAFASLKMLYALDQLAHDLPLQGFPAPDIGIGLSTTPASVGNMGSDARFSYTAMGDGVNLGSRLESLTKSYGVKILMSSATAEALPPGLFLMRDLDDIRVKGKSEPVKVFELMRPDYVPTEQQVRDLIGEFELARKAYLDQDWKSCETHLLKCQTLNPNDGPTKLYLDRVAEYKQNSPGSSWDGVYTFAHK